MHFRPQLTKRSSSSASLAKTPIEIISETPTPPVEAIEEESQMATLGVSCWDFAYPTGKCSLPPVKNCCFSKQQQPNSVHHERFITQTLAPAYEVLNGGPPQPKSKKHSRNTSQPLESKTYLLSSPTPSSITYPQTYTTISTLLSQPNTKLVYLVPQSNIVCPKVCELMRLSRAAGSSFQILPVRPEIEMKCGGAERSSIVDALAVQEVAEKVVKNTKIRNFDGFIAFEDDREAWTFLEHVGKFVKSTVRKP